MSTIRKLRRDIARRKMKEEGMTKLNKKRGGGEKKERVGSIFANNWRLFG